MKPFQRYGLLAAGLVLFLAGPAASRADSSPCDAAFGELVHLSADMAECEMNRFMFERIPSILGKCSAEERQVLEESREGFAEDMQRLCPPPPAPAKEAAPQPVPPAAKMPEFPAGLE